MSDIYIVAQNLYKTFNNEFFGNSLPSAVLIRKNRDPKMIEDVAAYVSGGSNIYFNNYVLKKNPERLAAILLHEMIHLKLMGVRDTDDHGKQFQLERNRILSMGGYPSPGDGSWEYEPEETFNRKYV